MSTEDDVPGKLIELRARVDQFFDSTGAGLSALESSGLATMDRDIGVEWVADPGTAISQVDSAVCGKADGWSASGRFAPGGAERALAGARGWTEVMGSSWFSV